MTDLVDWELAAATAARLGGGGPSTSPREAVAAVEELNRAALAAEQHVADFTHLSPPSGVQHPPVRVIDRVDWARTNVTGFQTVLGPVVDQLQRGRPTPGPVATAVGSRVTGVQMGAILAFLSSRVLGQFEVLSAPPGALLLVAPNIVAAEQTLGVVPADFRLWVCIHEVTHRTQFSVVPWLREHFLAEIDAFVAASHPEDMVHRLTSAIAEVARVVRTRDGQASVLDIIGTPEQKAVLTRITALMTLVEGHAEFVMNGVGPLVVPTVNSIQAKFAKRRQGTSVVDKAIRRLLGLDAKMRQYAEGSKFVAAVVEQLGMDGFNRIWESPQTLPTTEEINDPASWIARVHGTSPVED